MLNGFERVLPYSNDLVHRGAGGGEALFGTKGVQDGVVMAEQGILNADLGCQEMRGEGEDGGDQGRETGKEMVISSMVSVGGRGQVGLGLCEGGCLPFGAFGLLRGRVNSGLVSLIVELLIFSFSNGLFHGQKVIPGGLSGTDDLVLDLGEILGEILLQLFIVGLEPVGSPNHVIWSVLRYMAVVVIASPNDGSINDLEFLENSMLMSEDGNP